MRTAIVENCSFIPRSFHVENVDELYTGQYDYKKPKSTDTVLQKSFLWYKFAICKENN